MPVTQPPTAVSATSISPSAVAWINGREAVVARISSAGQVSVCEMNRGWLPRPDYLAQVVRAIGDQQRLLILGPGSTRLILEREYVSIFRRSDRLVDVEPSGLVGARDLVERLRTLAA
jgi:hypothetical protein